MCLTPELYNSGVGMQLWPSAILMETQRDSGYRLSAVNESSLSIGTRWLVPPPVFPVLVVALVLFS